MRIAFYAPMKPPDHPVPSGDRRMAQLLVAALGEAGHGVEVVSHLRSYLAAPDLVTQGQIRNRADAERGRIAAAWADAGDPFDLWFTYHNYHKAPDLLGPDLARSFGLPYVIAEASRAPRRALEWAEWFVAADTAIRAADVHLCFTARDRSGLEPALSEDAVLVDLPPFIDVGAEPPRMARAVGSAPGIVAVAMMRPGDKLASYRLLAEALWALRHEAWHLTIVGDGSARAEVEAAFANFDPTRIRWTGALPAEAVSQELNRADLYAWPGFGEAFGLGYLEAQAAGLPVIALDVAGVSSVVRRDITGLLVTQASATAFADALQRLLGHAAERHRLGQAAAGWVRRERTLAGAARTLSGALEAAGRHARLRLDA